MINTSHECCAWSAGDPILEEYHDHEWCKVSHDDRLQFEMLCLEGASVGIVKDERKEKNDGKSGQLFE